MCHAISNVRKEFRRTTFPSGSTGSLDAIDLRFRDVDRIERARLSQRVLGALPPAQRELLLDWSAKTTKERPPAKGHVELMIFLAVGHAAKDEQPVHDVVAAIEMKKCCAGIILRAS